ncbi:MAG TPA: hypothetical protein VEN81_04710 [Planctomycetota bacterium]|nr:hypothetical protein [Planctomycetota bacterium]
MIEYTTPGRVRAAHARIIQEEIGQIGRRWWLGALGLEPGVIDGPVVLSGSTPLFRGRGIPDPDDLFMAFGDAAFIVDTLEDWARRFTLKWHIRMNGDDWGAIDPTGLSRPLLDQMEKWARRAGVGPRDKGAWPVSAERREVLFRAYPGT